MKHPAPLLLLVLLASTPALAESAFKDKDEGSMGPMQDKHEGQVVFANAQIKRDEKNEALLVQETTLAKPLFFRVYQAKTPARYLYENGQGSCLKQMRRSRWHAQLDGQKNGVWIRTGTFDEDGVFFELRSQTLVDLDQNVVSLVPTKKVKLPDPDGDAHPAFLELAASMKPGKNVVQIEIEQGCLGTKGKNGREWTVVSKGKITFDVKAGDLAAFAKVVGPTLDSPDAGAAARIKPQFGKTLVAGASLLAFGAESTKMEPGEPKSTKIRSLLLNADKTCSYQPGEWIEPFLGAGKYGPGHYDTVADPVLMPCP